MMVKFRSCNPSWHNKRMTQQRLKSKLIIDAAIRLCLEKAIPATVARRGDHNAGAIFLKVNGFDSGCIIYTQQQKIDGTLHWIKTPGDNLITEIEADAYLERQIKYDNDLWVLEIEDRQHRNPFN